MKRTCGSGHRTTQERHFAAAHIDGKSKIKHTHATNSHHHSHHHHQRCRVSYQKNTATSSSNRTKKKRSKHTGTQETPQHNTNHTRSQGKAAHDLVERNRRHGGYGTRARRRERNVHRKRQTREPLKSILLSWPTARLPSLSLLIPASPRGNAASPLSSAGVRR